MIRKFLARHSEFWFPEVSARMLALLRIILASALIYDVFTYLPQRHFLFGAGGILGDAGSRRPYPTLVSLFESWGSQGLALSTNALDFLFAIYLCALVALLIGFASRVAAAVVWMIFFYLNMRNYLMFDSGHGLASILLCFLIFLPTGTTGSLRRILKEKSGRHFWDEEMIREAWAVRAIQIQICIVYGSTFLFKLQGLNWRNGSAVYYATRSPIYFHPGSNPLLESPSFLIVANYGTLVLEGLFPILIWNSRLRPWVLGGALIFHLILEQIFLINIFQWVMIAGLVSFLGSSNLRSFFRWRNLPDSQR